MRPKSRRIGLIGGRGCRGRTPWPSPHPLLSSPPPPTEDWPLPRFGVEERKVDLIKSTTFNPGGLLDANPKELRGEGVTDAGRTVLGVLKARATGEAKRQRPDLTSHVL